jgi:hypothetical protein
MSRGVVVAALTAGLVVSAGSGLRAETYRNDAWHYGLELPDGWQQMPAEFVSALNSNMSRHKHPAYKGFEIHVGFHRADRLPPVPPIIAFQMNKWLRRPATYEDLERVMAQSMLLAESVAKDAPLPNLRELKYGATVVDRRKNRVVMRARLEGAAMGKGQSIAFGFIGVEGMLTMYCFAREADADDWLAVFESVADTVAFDPDYRFVPGTAGPAGDSGSRAGRGPAKGAENDGPVDRVIVWSVVAAVGLCLVYLVSRLPIARGRRRPGA